MRQGFGILVDPHFKAIAVVGIFYILQPLLPNAIQKREGVAADGMSVMHVLLTKSVFFAGLCLHQKTSSVSSVDIMDPIRVRSSSS